MHWLIVNQQLNKMDRKELEQNIIDVLKTIYDPEIPVNIYDLGLIYEIDFYSDNEIRVVMTLTTPNCPIADQILEEVNNRVNSMPEVEDATVVLTFEPPWDKDMMSQEAKLELGFL